MEGKRKGYRWLGRDYIILGLLCVAVIAMEGIFLLGVPGALSAWKESGEKSRVAEVSAAVEELMPKVPELKSFVVEKLELLEEVEEIFDAHEFYCLVGTGDNIVVATDNGGNYEALADSAVFTEEEKEKIASLFTGEGPLMEYDFIFRLDPDEYHSRERAETYIAHMDDSAAESERSHFYYMEEAADEWYVVIGPKGIVDRAVKDLDVYDKYVKSQREDGGLIRLPE